MAETPIISTLISVQSVAGNVTKPVSQQIPQALLTLPVGTFLSGSVLTRDSKGNPILRTEKGDLVIKSDLFLKIGTEVVIRIEGQGEQFRARIVSIDGHSPGAVAQGGVQEEAVLIEPFLLQSSGSAKESGNTGATVPSSTANSNALLKAILVSPAALTAELEALLPPSLTPALRALTVGSQVTLRLVNIDISQATASPVISSSSPVPGRPDSLFTSKPIVVPSNALYAIYAKQTLASPALLNVAVKTPPQAAPLPAITNIPDAPSVEKVVSVSPVAAPAAPSPVTAATETKTSPLPTSPQFNNPSPQSQPSSAVSPTTNPPPPAALPPGLPPGRLEGVVIGTEITREPLVQTKLGVIRLPVEASLLPGTRITFDVVTVTTPQAATEPSLLTGSDTAVESKKQWSALSQAMALLQHSYPDTAAQLQRQIPTIGPQFTTAVLFFIAALKGDTRQVLNEKAVRQLQELGQGELLQRLSGEFTLARAALADQPPPAPGQSHQWQMILIPVIYQGELHPTKLFVKKDGQKNQQQGKAEGEGTRFVMELELSELGPMQFDGFVKKRERKTAFDLMIRSIKGLTSVMENDITTIFNDAAQMTGFTGSVHFQTAKSFPINPLDEMMAERHRSILA